MKLNNDMLLSGMDIELINILRNKLLYPKTTTEFFEIIKILDEDKNIVDKLLGHSLLVFRSLTDYYLSRKDEDIDLIVNSI